MFGHQNDQATSKVVPEEDIHVGSGSETDNPANEPSPPATSAKPAITPGQGHPAAPATSVTSAAPAASSAPLTHSPHSYNPASHDDPDPSPAADNPTSDSVPASPDDPPATDNSTHELIDIKQQALSQLSPLVDHLDQSPVDKFRTTMMMIQASDDHTLIRTAYEAAKSIEDEKLRAQALLDIVNEINYFTQHQQQ